MTNNKTTILLLTMTATLIAGTLTSTPQAFAQQLTDAEQDAAIASLADAINQISDALNQLVASITQIDSDVQQLRTDVDNIQLIPGPPGPPGQQGPPGISPLPFDIVPIAINPDSKSINYSTPTGQTAILLYGDKLCRIDGTDTTVWIQFGSEVTVQQPSAAGCSIENGNIELKPGDTETDFQPGDILVLAIEDPFVFPPEYVEVYRETSVVGSAAHSSNP